LLGLIAIKILAPAYYARQDIKTPVKIGICTLLVTQLLNVLFFFFTPLRHAGLALAISLGACLNASLLFHGLLRKQVYRPAAGWLAFASKLLAAVGTMALVLLLLRHGLGGWLTDGKARAVIKLTILVGSGAASYFAMLYLFGFRPRDFARRAA
jgi:putative peptidoglycan lipid II flippase